MKKQTGCPICQSEMVWEHRTIRYEREGIHLSLENVWVSVCPECGQETVPGPLAVQMLNRAKKDSAQREEKNPT